jgi:type 1 glutamine amidotransferase
VEDEIYISAYDPQLRILAAAEWSGRLHPMAWVKPYGEGRVFYTTLGHGPGTFAQPGMQALLRAGAAWAAGG